MWWGVYSNRNGRSTWRSSANFSFTPIEQAEDTLISPDMSESEIESRIHARILTRAKLRREFIRHLVNFIILNIIIWAIWLLFFSGSDITWPLIVMLFSALNLAASG